MWCGTTPHARIGFRDHLKICQIQDLAKKGGASIAANRISSSLGHYNEIHQISSDLEYSDKLENKILLSSGRIIKFLELIGSPSFREILRRVRNQDIQRQLRKILSSSQPDIINIHNIHSSSWPLELIKTALGFAPVVWTLHDCWSFLGTYYPLHSIAPTTQTLSDMDTFWQSEQVKPSPHKLSAITPSAWMQSKASASYWDELLVETIHNPIPDSFFEYRDRNGCKLALGLDTHKPVVLCVAGNLKEERKGGPILQEIISTNLTHQVQFLFIGSGDIGFCNNSTIRSLGFVEDEVTLKIAYNAADLLLHPAPIDNLPNTVAESMSSGTPVLAFNTGGLPEMVVPGKSGWLASEISAASMLEKLEFLLASKDYVNLRESTKELAQLLYDSHNVGNQYIEHYKTALYGRK